MATLQDFVHRLKSQNHLVQHNKQHHRKVLLNSFHLKRYFYNSENSSTDPENIDDKCVYFCLFVCLFSFAFFLHVTNHGDTYSFCNDFTKPVKQLLDNWILFDANSIVLFCFMLTVNVDFCFTCM